MSYMFYNCYSRNVTDMSFMFYNCSSLINLPDISKWNTKNVIDMSNMCEKCSLITSLPDISKWNIDRIKYMNKMFRYCRKLSSIPDFSNWTINNDTENDNMFEGDIILENLPKFRIKNKNLLQCFIRCSDCTKIIKNILAYIFFERDDLLFLFGVLFILFIYFFPYFLLNDLDNIKECINNPINYFNLLNHINITYIAELKNNTNESIIEEMYSDKEMAIRKILNFTHINGEITFNSNYSIYKFIDISIKYLFLFFLIFFIFVVFNVQNKFKYLDPEKSIYLLVIIFFLDIFSLFIHFWFFIINEKLSASINKYFETIEKYFKIEIPKLINDEFEYFKCYLLPLINIIMIFIFAFIYIFILCKKIHNIREKNNLKYLINN